MVSRNDFCWKNRKKKYRFIIDIKIVRIIAIHVTRNLTNKRSAIYLSLWIDYKYRTSAKLCAILLIQSNRNRLTLNVVPFVHYAFFCRHTLCGGRLKVATVVRRNSVSSLTPKWHRCPKKKRETFFVLFIFLVSGALGHCMFALFVECFLVASFQKKREEINTDKLALTQSWFT